MLAISSGTYLNEALASDGDAHMEKYARSSATHVDLCCRMYPLQVLKSSRFNPYTVLALSEAVGVKEKDNTLENKSHYKIRLHVAWDVSTLTKEMGN